MATYQGQEKGNPRHWTNMSALPSGTPPGAKVGSTWEFKGTDARGLFRYVKDIGGTASWACDGILYELQIEHGDLTAAATTETISFTDALPAACVIQSAWMELDTVFSGGSVSACTAQFGTTGDPNLLMAATDVFTGATTGTQETTPGVAFDGTQNTVEEGGTTLKVLFTSTTDNVVNLSAGDLTVKALVLVPQGLN